MPHEAPWQQDAQQGMKPGKLATIKTERIHTSKAKTTAHYSTFRTPALPANVQVAYRLFTNLIERR